MLALTTRDAPAWKCCLGRNVFRWHFIIGSIWAFWPGCHSIATCFELTSSKNCTDRKTSSPTSPSLSIMENGCGSKWTPENDFYSAWSPRFPSHHTLFCKGSVGWTEGLLANWSWTASTRNVFILNSLIRTLRRERTVIYMNVVPRSTVNTNGETEN